MQLTVKSVENIERLRNVRNSEFSMCRGICFLFLFNYSSLFWENMTLRLSAEERAKLILSGEFSFHGNQKRIFDKVIFEIRQAEQSVFEQMREKAAMECADSESFEGRALAERIRAIRLDDL